MTRRAGCAKILREELSEQNEQLGQRPSAGLSLASTRRFRVLKASWRRLPKTVLCLIRNLDFLLSGKGSSGGNIAYLTFKNLTDCSEGKRLGIWMAMGMVIGNRRLKR